MRGGKSTLLPLFIEIGGLALASTDPVRAQSGVHVHGEWMLLLEGAAFGPHPGSAGSAKVPGPHRFARARASRAWVRSSRAHTAGSRDREALLSTPRFGARDVLLMHPDHIGTVHHVEGQAKAAHHLFLLLTQFLRRAADHHSPAALGQKHFPQDQARPDRLLDTPITIPGQRSSDHGAAT